MSECNALEICRACLRENANFLSIFTSDERSGLKIHFAEMIMACASVQMTLGDGLPEQICTQCAEKAVQLYLFKSTCEKSDSTLRQQLGKSPFVDPFNKESGLFFLGNQLDSTQGSENVVVKPEINLDNEEGSLPDNTESYDMNEIEISKSENEEQTMLVAKLECTVCLKVFTNEKDFEKHKKSHIPKPFVCETCSKSFSRDDLLLRHKIIHAIKLQDKSVKCESFEGLDNRITLNDDFEDRNNGFQYFECPTLKEEEPSEEKHNKNRNGCIQCKVCNKRFSKGSHLTRHMKTHAAIKPYSCQLCSKGFARAEQLMNHMNAHSGIKPHVCKICSKGFNQISNLRDHMRTHNGEKPFLCSTCGKGFNQLGNLRQHTIRHSGIKAHLCSICGNGFASKGELCAHLRKHTGARPFVCQICNHGFTTSSSLTKHKRIHSGEKPYECEVCKMRFSRSGILARHKRTHTGEKPYVCQYCSKAFSQSNDLSSHLRIHTGEKPFICDSCGQAFRQSSALKTHKKTHIDKSSVDSGIDTKTVLNHIVHSTCLNAL